MHAHLVLWLDVEGIHNLDCVPDGVLIVAGHHDTNSLNNKYVRIFNKCLIELVFSIKICYPLSKEACSTNIFLDLFQSPTQSIKVKAYK